jgi:hypothetical protein
MKTLVLYVFYEINSRVNYFINNAIFYDENVDFILISNNNTATFNVQHYVKIMHRDNIGYDFGGWSDALLTNNLYMNYDNYIFVNSSVIGPFIPAYCKEKWTTIYINGLKDNVKLFGSTINTCGNPLFQSHVQSYIFAMDKPTLEYLINCEIFSITNCAKTFDEAIWNKEVLMSRKIIENGWNIGSLLKQYDGVDFTFKGKQPHDYKITFFGDIMNEECRNKLWNEYEQIFIKGNRNFVPLTPIMTYFKS